MLNVTNLLTQRLNKIAPSQENEGAKEPVMTKPQAQMQSGLISAYLDNLARINAPKVEQTKKIEQASKADKVEYHNDLKTLLNNNEAKILAIVPRLFNAKDTNGNEYIDGNEQHGTFKNAIERLDEIKEGGYNTLHILPINTPGKVKAMGTAGSVYSPKDLLEIDPMLLDPDDPSFSSPGDLPSAAKEYCRRTAQPIPETIGEVVRCFYESLALTYRRTLEGIQDCTGKKYHKIYVVGGGTRDRLLLQMTADSCGVPVSAGPVEATVFGNLLVQLIAAGEISSIAEGREIIRQSEPPVLLMPSHTEAWENAYHRFVALTKKEKRFE